MEDIQDQEVEMTFELVKVVTGQFDKTSILSLPLCGLDIKQIQNLDGLSRLHTLNLSNNKIMSLSGGFEGVQRCLKRLDLRFNRISKLDGLQSLEVLEVVYLQGNFVRDLDTVIGLAGNQRLRGLHLKDRDGSNPNPVCTIPNYKSVVMKKLPRLGTLDGEFFLSEQSNALALTDGEGLEVVLPSSQPWISSSLLSDATFISTKQFISSSTAIAADLFQECDLLLQQADTAIKKQSEIVKIKK